jgi:hypothetical protein
LTPFHFEEYGGALLPADSGALPDQLGDPGDPWPDSLTNGKYFVFLHGFNITGQNAEGWHSEVFKRLHVAGSNARFVGVSWHGGTGANYHRGVVRAFETGDALRTRVEAVTGPSADVTIAAHSLGNMVVSHAIQKHGYSPSRYFMINGAVALESYDPAASNPETYDSSLQGLSMIESSWSSLPERLMAAKWHELFASDPTDRRNDLTWNDNFSGVRDLIFNFYSPGEDVVENSALTNASLFQAFSDFSISRGAWKTQEVVKGTSYASATFFFNRKQAGWGKSSHHSSPNGISDSELRTIPYFDPFEESDLTSTNAAIASAKASEPHVFYDLLARAIPSLSFATAANAIKNLNSDRNINMETVGRNGTDWPSQGHLGPAQGDWLHSDFKAVALPYVYPFFEKLITIGDLQ